MKTLKQENRDFFLILISFTRKTIPLKFISDYNDFVILPDIPDMGRNVLLPCKNLKEKDHCCHKSYHNYRYPTAFMWLDKGDTMPRPWKHKPKSEVVP
jgi:hypothetical protein